MIILRMLFQIINFPFLLLLQFIQIKSIITKTFHLMFEKKYIIMETIGRNSQKMTSIVKNKSNNYFIAKKVPINDQKTMHEVIKKRIQIEMMKGLNHPNIIALHEIIEQEKWAYIIQEYCEEGDLQYYLKRQSKFKKLIQQEVVSRWLLQLLLAIQYLHHLKIIHRDIRPKNIFLTSNGNIKLGSFKVSKVLEEQANYAQTLINSPYYLTPQLAEGKAYDYKVDIWAFGCVLFEICSLKPPINLSNIGELFLKVTKGKLDDLPYQYSKQLNMLYQRCMKRNPNQRISAKQLLKTSYFLEVIEKFITDKGFNINFQQKIPIKRYNIHNSKYQRLKIKKKLISNKNLEKKDNLLPKIQIQTNKIEKKVNSRQKLQKKPMIQTPIFKRHSKNKQGEQRIQKCYSTDKKVVRSDSVKKGVKKLERPPTILMEQKQKVSPKPNKQKQKKLMLAPPLLPKPAKNSPQLNSDRRAKTKVTQITQIGQSSQNFQATMSKQQLARELNIFQKKDLAEVNEGLNKIFENLKIRQDDEEQIQFDFQDETQLRLTSKQDEAASLLNTCKSKLQQLIDEINYKYCPNMQPIPQKTTQFDSNSFSNAFFNVRAIPQ